MEVAYQLNICVNKKRSVSMNTKLRYICTGVRPEDLYVADCLEINSQDMNEKF